MIRHSGMLFKSFHSNRSNRLDVLAELLITERVLVLGVMTENVHHGIFQNYNLFRVYEGSFFLHIWVLTTFCNNLETNGCT